MTNSKRSAGIKLAAKGRLNKAMTIASRKYMTVVAAMMPADNSGETRPLHADAWRGRRSSLSKNRRRRASRGNSGAPNGRRVLDRQITLDKIAQIGQPRDRDHREPNAIRRERCRSDEPDVRKQRQDDAGKDQEFAGGQDLVLRHQADKAVHLLAPADQQHRRHGGADRHPRRLRQNSRAEGIHEEVCRRDDQGSARLGLSRFDPQEDEQPHAAMASKPGAKGKRMRRFDQIKERSGERQQRKGAHPARHFGLVAFVDFLETRDRESRREPEARANRSASWIGGITRVLHQTCVLELVCRRYGSEHR